MMQARLDQLIEGANRMRPVVEAAQEYREACTAAADEWESEFRRVRRDKACKELFDAVRAYESSQPNKANDIEWVELRRTDQDGNSEVLRIRKGTRTLDEIRASSQPSTQTTEQSDGEER
jgi:hypothetical protein